MRPRMKIDPVLLIGLGIPVVMTVLIAAAVVVPRYFSGIEDPSYDHNMTFVGWIEE